MTEPLESIPLVALLGQSNAQGTNSAAALAIGRPEYSGPQANYYIYNWAAASPGFEIYEAGVNSSPGSATPVFGMEVAFAQPLRNVYQNGVAGTPVAVYKQAVSGSSLNFISGLSCWSPCAGTGPGLEYSKLIAQLNAARATLVNGSTPVELKHVVWNQGESDALDSWSAATYEMGLGELFRRIRTDLELPDLSFTVYKVHTSYSLPNATWRNMVRVRSAQTWIAATDQLVGLVNTDTFGILPDNTHYTVDGTIDAGLALEPAILYGHGPTLNLGWGGEEATTPATVADLYVLLGADNAEGAGNINELPIYLNSALSDVSIWQTRVQPVGWQTLQAGVNEQATSGSTTRAGMTLSLGYELRKKHPGKTVYLLKHAIDGSPLTPSATVGPDAWSPAMPTSHYSDLLAELDACVSDLLTNQGFQSVVVHGIIWSQGEVDAQQEQLAASYGGALRYFVEQLRYDLRNRPSGNLSPTTVPFVVCQTHRDFAGQHIDTVRAGQDRVFREVDFTGLVDTTFGTIDTATGRLDMTSLVDLGYRAAAALDNLDSSLQPLFVPTFPLLLSRLRLSGVPEDRDAMEQIREGMREARTTFYRRLRLLKIEEIQSFASTGTPRTDNEYFRTLAELVEVKLVKASLLRSLKTIFADGGNDLGQMWNEAGLGRQMDRYDIEKEIKRLESEIEDALQILEGSELPGAEHSIESMVVGTTDEDDVPSPRDSVFGYPFGTRNPDIFGGAY